MQTWTVHKFGGTSVRDAARYRGVSQIITQDSSSSRQAVVVSAMKGTTDDLIEAVDLAARQDESYLSLLKKIHSRHLHEITELLDSTNCQRLAEVFARDSAELSEILRGVWLVKNASGNVMDLVSGMGEVWSAQILNAYFQQQGLKTDWLDARKILVVSHVDQRVVVDWEKSQQRMDEWLKTHDFKIMTVTGFVAATLDGINTTLGRNGSDYTGSIFGALLNAQAIVIWTDVDGVLSADPRLVPEAVVLTEMSYSEVTELAYFGAKVVHPATMAPAIAKQIPIWIKNSFKPELPGTKISHSAPSERSVKGFSTIDKMCLINIEGTGMAGIPGIAERLFGSLCATGVSVVLISQASSEHSICVAIHQAQRDVARAAIDKAFYAEIQLGLIQTIHVTDHVSILAAVGDTMARSPGVSGRFFTALGRSGVNVIAIAQGSSERNISAVIDSRDEIKALRTVHSDFILPHQRFSIGVIGLGLIGGTFLRQLNERLAQLRLTHKVDFQVRAIADSKRMLLSENEISLNNWKEQLASNGEPLSLERLAQHIRPSHIPHAVIIEATASAALAPRYKEWLAQGIHLISPNKQANTGTMHEYREIRRAAHLAGRHFLYATNVGAGLPILHTLRDLHATGDEILTIQGILSGTLSFIFNAYDGTQPFSEVVKLAKAQGFTEPDPREDLSGQDVMRKVVILAREAGLSIEVGDVKIDGLVPENLRSVSVDEFMSRLTELDAPMLAKLNQAKAANQILRFVGTLSVIGVGTVCAHKAHAAIGKVGAADAAGADPGHVAGSPLDADTTNGSRVQARVGLEVLPRQHAFANVSGTDNIVLFKTKRYLKQPLVVQGPGAGPEVTAAGVFADLLRLSQYLGAQLQGSAAPGDR